MRALAVLALVVVLADGNALAGATTNAPDSQATSTPPALSKEVDEKAGPSRLRSPLISFLTTRNMCSLP